MTKATEASSYELTFILKEESDSVLKKVIDIVEAQNGKIDKKDTVGRKKFAYRIKKESSGCYFDWHISLQKENVKKLKKNLDFEEEVLRYLLLNKE